ASGPGRRRPAGDARPVAAHADRPAAAGPAPRNAHARRLARTTMSEPMDVRERGANQQLSERRLWMQLQVFGGCADAKPLVRALESSGCEAVLYHDLSDPRGVGVLALHEDPAFFVGPFREVLGAEPFGVLARKPELTMFGRT